MTEECIKSSQPKQPVPHPRFKPESFETKVLTPRKEQLNMRMESFAY
jgi:hypothetical protein